MNSLFLAFARNRKIFLGGRLWKKIESPSGNIGFQQRSVRNALSSLSRDFGYKKTASIAGLNTYTVRDYKRKYAAGDTSWAYRVIE